MPVAHIPQEVQEVLDKNHEKAIASLLITGASAKSIADELKITPYRLNKIMRTEEFKDTLQSICEEMLSVAANTWRGMMQELIPLAYKSLKKALERGDLKGVEIVIKSMGLDKQIAQTQASSLQIVLPDYNTKTIEVEHESKDRS